MIMTGKSTLLAYNGNHIALKRKSKNIIVRVAPPSELIKILSVSDDASNKQKEKIYQNNFDKGHFCYIVEYKGVVAGYCWAFIDSYIITFDSYNFSWINSRVNKDSAVFGDGYINPVYRLRGLYPFLMAGMVDDLSVRYNMTRFLAFVYSQNEHSLKSHARLGFRKFQDYYFIKLLNIKMLFIKRSPGKMSFINVNKKNVIVNM